MIGIGMFDLLIGGVLFGQAMFYKNISKLDRMFTISVSIICFIVGFLNML